MPPLPCGYSHLSPLTFDSCLASVIAPRHPCTLCLFSFHFLPLAVSSPPFSALYRPILVFLILRLSFCSCHWCVLLWLDRLADFSTLFFTGPERNYSFCQMSVTLNGNEWLSNSSPCRECVYYVS